MIGAKVLLSLLITTQGQEIITTTPTLPDGSAANAPVSNEQAVRNWTSYGLGCCVVASQRAALHYLAQQFEEPGLLEVSKDLYDGSRQEPGGHDPEKLERLFRRVQQRHPDFKWIQWYGQPDGWERAKEWSAAGYPVCVTWGTGRRYANMPIAHMVTTTHLSDDFVQIKDNNFTEEYSTVPGPEGRRRIKMMGLEWYVVPLPHALATNFDWGLAAIVFGTLVIYASVIYATVAAWARRLA